MIKNLLSLSRPAVRPRLFVAIAVSLTVASSAHAQEVGADGLVDADLATLVVIEDRLNAADICQPLQFDLRTVSSLVGLPIPAFIPIDTNLRWDQSRHRMTRFASTPTDVVLDFRMGCQPSTNGAVLDYLGLSPDKVRLDDAVSCKGRRIADGDLDTLVCTVEGKVGKLLAKTIIGLSDKIGRLLPMQLAVAVPATPTQTTVPDTRTDAPLGASDPVDTAVSPTADTAKKTPTAPRPSDEER
ncbi:MAG TPA: hypothetical protein ENH55_03285 [Aurantimonas coralicida]|uniref:Uncharacterized protein n=1 Tax=marine sediment metagenome TaxID=412755 RepID=A0A0F9VHS3_9ZZZZ|nr:hypothetical protein [Aurantimonas coralicida]